MATAQDIITKKDGTDIQVRVKEVSPTEVKYLRWDNQEGPLFILPASDILIIRFENGSNYVMDKPSSSLSERTSLFVSDPSVLDLNGLKYNQLKRYYSTADYDQLYSPRYGLGYPWLNLIFPGLAQYCMGEGGLGTKYLLMSLGCSILCGVGVGMADVRYYNGYNKTYSQPYGGAGSVLTLVAGAAGIAVGVCSIVNAYHVAKVKSLYAEDMYNYSRGYSLIMAPTVLWASTGSGLQPAPGLGIRVTF